MIKIIMVMAAADLKDLRIPPSNHLEKLKAEGIIVRIGGNKGGYWHINKTNESK